MPKQITNDQFISVTIITESDCDPTIGEYSLYLISSTSSLQLGAPGGNDDIQLIIGCIEEAISDPINSIDLPEEGTTNLILRVNYEQEYVFTNKYYSVFSYESYDHNEQVEYFETEE